MGGGSQRGTQKAQHEHTSSLGRRVRGSVVDSGVGTGMIVRFSGVATLVHGICVHLLDSSRTNTEAEKVPYIVHCPF